MSVTQSPHISQPVGMRRVKGGVTVREMGSEGTCDGCSEGRCQGSCM